MVCTTVRQTPLLQMFPLGFCLFLHAVLLLLYAVPPDAHSDVFAELPLLSSLTSSGDQTHLRDKMTPMEMILLT